MTDAVIHDYVPSSLDDLLGVDEDDLLNTVFVVYEYTTDISSKFTNRVGRAHAYSELILDRGDGVKVKWRTSSGTIADQLKRQELPFRATLIMLSRFGGYLYTSFAPASQATPPSLPEFLSMDQPTTGPVRLLRPFPRAPGLAEEEAEPQGRES